MNEAKAQSRFTRFIKGAVRGKHDALTHPFRHGARRSHVFELKCKRMGKRINFKSDISPHQFTALKDAKYSCVYQKISDMDVRTKPADAFILCDSGAWFIFCWYEHGRLTAYWVDIDVVLDMRDNLGYKSITEDQARMCATYITPLR